jgi:hypothetical protein
MKVKWLEAPERHDYRAAEEYLRLLMVPSEAKEIAGLLRDADTAARFKAKDIVRASGLPILPASNRHVRGDVAKIKAGKRLSPILLVRPLAPGSPLVIADGYRRVCAAYLLGEDIPIPCRIVGAPGAWRVSR